MARPLFSSIEPLESRIAPANLTPLHPLPNITEGFQTNGNVTGHKIDLGTMFDASASYDTFVTFTTNFDTDPNTPGLQAGVFTMELYDGVAPLTVQNFLNYIQGTGPAGDEYLNSFFSRLVPGFVLQGGGFSAGTDAAPLTGAALGTHITTFPTVHNEFGLSNTQWTVALAKTGQGPSTGTSEFYINLADNSSNLDQQNGGFTVFGKIISGTDVIQKIASLNTGSLVSATGNGALSDVPNTSGVPGQTPTTSQLVKFTDISVSHHDGTSPSYTFAVTDTDASGILKSGNPFTYDASTQSLTLNYSGKAGTATISVTATDSQGSSVTTPFTVTVKPNLIINSVSDTLQNFISEGDTGKATFKITNTGAVNFTGLVDVNVYLVPNGVTPQLTLDSTTSHSYLLGTLSGASLNLDAGKSTTLTASHLALGIPNLDQLSLNGDYQIVEQIVPQPDATPGLYSDKPVTVEGGIHSVYNLFGSYAAGFNAKGQPIGKHINTSFSYYNTGTADDGSSHGNLVTLTYKGGGAGVVIPGVNGGAPSIATGYINELQGNAATSSLSLKIGQGTASSPLSASTHITFENLDLQTIGTISLGKADFTNDIDIGGAKSITLGNLGDGKSGNDANSFTFHLGATQFAAAITLGDVANYDFTAASKVKSITANSWVSTTTTVDAADADKSDPKLETISAPGLTSLVIKGALTENVSINSVTPSATPLLKTFTVGGALTNSVVQIGGSVGKVTLGSMDSSEFLVGVALPASGNAPVIPTIRTGFASVQNIASFIVGKSGDAGVDMKASTVAAATIGSVSVFKVDSATEDSDFGFVAASIAKYQHDGQTKSPLAVGDNDRTGQYVVTILGSTAST